MCGPKGKLTRNARTLSEVLRPDRRPLGEWCGCALAVELVLGSPVHVNWMRNAQPVGVLPKRTPARHSPSSRRIPAAETRQLRKRAHPSPPPCAPRHIPHARRALIAARETPPRALRTAASATAATRLAGGPHVGLGAHHIARALRRVRRGRWPRCRERGDAVVSSPRGSLGAGASAARTPFLPVLDIFTALRCPSEPRLLWAFCARRDQAHRSEALETESVEANQASTNGRNKLAAVIARRKPCT
jgi:hypothetical protein